MASVVVKDGRLILQFRVDGVQLREALHLRDTGANRKWAHTECLLIERELAFGNFDYWRHFPKSRSLKALRLFPKARTAENTDVSSWMKRWFEMVKPRWGNATAYDVETMINRHILPNLGHLGLAELTLEDIALFTAVLRKCRGIRGEAMGADRINKILKVLKRSLQCSVDLGLLERSPMSTWTALRMPKPEMRPFTKEEFVLLLEALPSCWKPYFEFAVWTGLRPGEQAALRWSEVKLNSKPPVVEIRATLSARNGGQLNPPKTAESARAVELIGPAVVALQSQQINSVSEWVFGGPSGAALNVSNLTRRVYYPAINKAGLVGRSLYNLRHTFAVFMLESGENPGWIARQMGHTSVEMLWRRYARWWPQLARSDGSRIERWWHEGKKSCAQYVVSE